MHERNAILVVDASASVRQSLARILASEGEVLATRSVADAIALEPGRRVRVVLVDPGTPGPGTADALRALGRVVPEASMILLISHLTAEVFVTAARLQAWATVCGILEKPFHPGDLVQQVRRVLMTRA